MLVSHQSRKGASLAAGASSVLFTPWRVVLALLLTLATLPLVGVSTARGTEYPTSVNYGGFNKSVDFSSEWAAEGAAMDASADEGKSLWLGLSPLDQERNPWLNPAYRNTFIEEGYGPEAIDSPRVASSSSEFTTDAKAPRSWCDGGIVGVGIATIPVTKLWMWDLGYSKIGNVFKLGAEAWAYDCGNGRTRVYFMVRSYGKSLPQAIDAVQPEYQIKALRENGEEKAYSKNGEWFFSVTPDSDNLATPYAIRNFSIIEFPTPAGGAVAGRRAKELKLPVGVYDSGGVMKPRVLKDSFEYATHLVQP